MPIARAESRAVAYLILRHLYDGDIIEWPIADDHPQREVFADLENQGFIARWDRIWPLHDRYRLTDKGMAAIEAVYKPGNSEAVFDHMKRSNLRPADRRRYLQDNGYDPYLWPVVHDPYTHWTTYPETGARYQQYVWEDEAPHRHLRRSGPAPEIREEPVPRTIDEPRVGTLDLDREAADHHHHAPEQGDYDVS